MFTALNILEYVNCVTFTLCPRKYFGNMACIRKDVPIAFHIVRILKSYIYILFFCPDKNIDSIYYVDIAKSLNGMKSTFKFYRCVKPYLLSASNYISYWCFNLN